jgi:hypothetical protein
LRKFFDEVRANANQVRKVNLYLDCELLMDKKIAEKIKRFKEAGVTIANIACNASILTEKRVNDCANLPCKLQHSHNRCFRKAINSNDHATMN